MTPETAKACAEFLGCNYEVLRENNGRVYSLLDGDPMGADDLLGAILRKAQELGLAPIVRHVLKNGLGGREEWMATFDAAIMNHEYADTPLDALTAAVVAYQTNSESPASAP